MSIIAKGSKSAPILVVTDAPSNRAYQEGEVMDAKSFLLFVDAAEEVGFRGKDFVFVTPCSPIPYEDIKSERRKKEHLAKYKEAFDATISRTKPRVVVTLGATGSRQYLGKPVKITKARGQPTMMEGGVAHMAMLSPSYCTTYPENDPMFRADFSTLKRLADADYDVEAITASDLDYSWCLDLSSWLADRPAIIALDCETQGNKWFKPESRVLTVQMSREVGKAIMVPVDRKYFKNIKPAQHSLLMGQLGELLADPAVEKIGHNLKFDVTMLEERGGFRVRGWKDDTMQMAFAIDENMLSKSQDDCVRRFVPAMAGFNDWFLYDKSDMAAVPLDDMLRYGCGDADTCLRLWEATMPLLKKDKRQYACYRKVMMPALRAFAYVVERNGINIDQKALAEFGESLKARSKELSRKLIAMVPPVVKRRHALIGSGKNSKTGISFTRPDFIRDVLFSEDGFNLKVYVCTPATANLPEDQQIPSTGKNHLAYHRRNKFVDGYVELNKIAKMISTYVEGFDRIIHDGRIFPSYHLHRTTTGRTASSDPNGQNIPKRGPLAKAFRKTLVAPSPRIRGRARTEWVLFSLDYSQIELRLVASMAEEPTMIDVYANGGDIHRETGIAVAEITDKAYEALPDEEKELIRFKAKAVNFGLIYKMSWRGFQSYAFVNYGIELNDRDAKNTVAAFFAKYSYLSTWHEAMEGFVTEHGYVRAMHGALRRLPNIRSDDSGVVASAVRQAINSPIQRMASDMGVRSVAQIAMVAPRWLRPNGFIHDAAIGYCEKPALEEAIAGCRTIMETIPLKKMFGVSLKVPIVADAEYGHNGADMAKLKDRSHSIPPWARW